MTEYVVRFLVGGVVVSAFAMLGDMLRPKSFAALFGAAPSVALATLGIGVHRHGADYAPQQTWAMARCDRARGLSGRRLPTPHSRPATCPACHVAVLVVWLVVAFGLLILAGGQT